MERYRRPDAFHFRLRSNESGAAEANGGRGINVTQRFRRALRAAAVFLVLSAATAGAQATSVQTSTDTLRLTVDDAVRFALRDGLEASLAREEVRAAQSAVGVARSYALPQVNASGTYTRNLKKPVLFFEIDPGDVQSFELGQDNAWFGGVSLTQTIYAFGRLRSGYRMAKDRAVAAESAGDDVAAAIAREVKTSYYFVLLAAAQVDIAEKSLENAERNASNIADRVRQGVTADFDRLRAEVTVEERKPIVTRVGNDYRIALETLKRLLRVPLDHPVVLTDSLAYEPHPETLDEVMTRALAGRRDLQAARAEASAAEYQRKAQAAMLRPLLNLDASASWQGETSSNFWPGDMEAASSAAVGVSLVWPLFDGLRNRNEVRIAQAQERAARIQEERLSDIVRLEVRSSYSEVTTIALEIVGATRAVEVARDAYRIAQVRYDTGASRLIELLDSELALIQSAVVLNETLYRYNVAVANLEYSAGEGPKLGLNNGEENK
jgi:outer membrane protein